MFLRERNSFALRQLLQPGWVKSMNLSATVFMGETSDMEEGVQGYSRVASSVKTTCLHDGFRAFRVRCSAILKPLCMPVESHHP